MPSAARTALRFLAPDSPGAVASGLRRAVLVALMPRLLRRHHVVDLLEMLDGDGSAGADARKVVDGLRRRPTTCLYQSLAGFASLRGAGEPVGEPFLSGMCKGSIALAESALPSGFLE